MLYFAIKNLDLVKIAIVLVVLVEVIVSVILYTSDLKLALSCYCLHIEIISRLVTEDE